MMNALRELLDALDVIAENHLEIHDTAVREELGWEIYVGFVRLDLDKLQQRNNQPYYYAMFSDEANLLIGKAISRFLEHPDVQVERSQLQTAQERLDAFQNHDIKSNQGNAYDWYFGHISLPDDYSE